MKITCTNKDLIPKYQTAGSAAFDLHSAEEKITILAKGDTVLIKTGISIELPEGMCARVLPRSSQGIKGIDVHHGLIDPDYRGEIGVILKNNSNSMSILKVSYGDRIAQLLVHPYYRANITVVENLSETSRGSGGFGSTGC